MAAWKREKRGKVQCTTAKVSKSVSKQVNHSEYRVAIDKKMQPPNQKRITREAQTKIRKTEK